jgi:hypothetical protein
LSRRGHHAPSDGRGAGAAQRRRAPDRGPDPSVPVRLTGQLSRCVCGWCSRPSRPATTGPVWPMRAWWTEPPTALSTARPSSRPPVIWPAARTWPPLLAACTTGSPPPSRNRRHVSLDRRHRPGLRPSAGLELVKRLAELRRSGAAGMDRVVGVGMDSTERGIDPASYRPAFAGLTPTGSARTCGAKARRSAGQTQPHEWPTTRRSGRFA